SSGGGKLDRRPTARLCQRVWAPGHEQASAGRMASPVPPGCRWIPRSAPAEAVAEDQPARAAHGQLLEEHGKLELLGQAAARVPARQPDVSPGESGARGQVDVDALVIAASLKGNSRPRQN